VSPAIKTPKKRLGRPPAAPGTTLDEIHGAQKVYLRCREGEREAWEAAAKAEDRDLATWCRHHLNNVAKGGSK
jgi:hypothetical protein